MTDVAINFSQSPFIIFVHMLTSEGLFVYGR